MNEIKKLRAAQPNDDNVVNKQINRSKYHTNYFIVVKSNSCQSRDHTQSTL